MSRFVIAVFPRSKHLLISWQQSLSALILEPKKMKSATVASFSPSICHEVMGPDAIIFVFWMVSYKPGFFALLLHHLILHFLPKGWCSAYLRLLMFLSAILNPRCASSSLTFCMTALTYYFPSLEPVHCSMSGSVASWPAYRFSQEANQFSSPKNPMNIMLTSNLFHRCV